MKIANRSINTILKAPLELRHYRAATNMVFKCTNPADAFTRYLFGRGNYPADITLRTPTGKVEATCYSHHDMLTVSEIFFREDYSCPETIRVAVDFGSNIGISALYFLSRNDYSFVYLFEPLPVNGTRLVSNLRRYVGRYQLSIVAVGLSTGEVEFDYEPTGRYGGIGLDTGHTAIVPCRAATEIIDEILERHGRIDVLKVDIEALEKEIIFSLGTRVAHIDNIFVEQSFTDNPFADTHVYDQYGNVAQFRLAARRRA